jgi:soluble lytic murein transglycosylase
MLRQESLFNPGAISWADARGLGQIMPATAQGIAQNLKVEGFQEADLLRPVVSIRFGAFYLSRQLAAMDGSLQGALSAYNGGPGNAQRWAGGATIADPDLFTEGIDYPETRGYVRLVYGYYGAYKRLYRWPGGVEN